ncbi:ribosomal maturation YjgA family protein [Methylobacterium sp. Leaf106]|uniref:ribosomal maturation YjgA family protein n=1 Tax=Methylobacterium sp. Leaf106 TaxID=1736255 RepID=UPI0006FF467C|nr:DUF2809 domain-containing protein [Methylobacterium sp. Leaf106]KQP40512.1 hypothetical protein ASF34_12015 [Methylobacterium sp. Leaf106]
MTPATTSRPTGRIRSRGGCLAAGLAIIVVGLSLRFVPLGLPMGIVKYGGSALWAAMVYALVAALLPHRNGQAILLVAGAIALVVELSRLVHTPWLDAFRLTLPGALLLGRIFSPWNLVAYAAGLTASALVDRWAGLRAKGG